MKKILILIFISIFYFSLTGQDGDRVAELIKQGVVLHDKGDYSGAIENYDKALKIEPNHVTALAEKGFSLLSMEEYEKAIEACQQAIENNPEAKGLKYVYTTYANALDQSKKPNKAIEIYNKGIEDFPDYYQLHFNKGITLTGLKKYEESLLSFHNSVSLNPSHASSHNAIARVLMIDKSNIPALLAFSRFLIIEPQGGRAEANLPYVKQIMTANVEKTGKKSVTINIDPSMLSDAEDKQKKENDFSTTDLILSMTAALDFDKKNRKKSEVELFMDKFETVCSSMEETQEDNYGFYWDYYVPYFVELKNKNLIEAFSYLVFASSDDKDIQAWLKKNEAKIDAFYKWSYEYQWVKN